VQSADPMPPSPHAKLRVQPLVTDMIHTAVWEGPCRFNVVTVDQETASVKRNYANWTKQVKSEAQQFGPRIEMLEPHLITFSESFTLPPEQLIPLEKNVANIDAFYVAPWGSSIATADLAKKYHKPIIITPVNCRTVDIAAYAKSIGEEVFIANDQTEVRSTLASLHARKIFRETRVLFPTNRGFPSVASLTGVTDLEDLERRQGVSVKMISYKVLADAMERSLADAALVRSAETDADALIRGATKSFLDRQYVTASFVFSRTVETLMEANGCNAFTVECFEFCSSRLPEKWKITPCMIHTLFKDRGIASSCEGDMGALLAMRLLMSVSGKSSHLGNMFFRPGGIVEINHSAPGIRMNGYEKPGLPYQLGRFTESGWGTKVVVDFMNNEEKRVTVARMHPNARQVLVMNGKLTSADGYNKDDLGCSVIARMTPAVTGNGRAFVDKQADYGNHLVWVYGDYAKEMEALGKVMGVAVEVVS
jgi:hypothetical protein